MISSRTTVPAGLVLSGLSLAAYPVLRPYGPEAGLAGAHDFASSAWLAAHALGMLGFVALAFSLRAAADSAPWPWTGQPVRRAETRAWLAIAFLLPYYGAEAYGLNQLGRYATEHGDVRVLDVADAFRFAPFEVTTFSIGLLLLLLVGGRLAHGLWHSGRLGRTGGLVAGGALMTYLPQFFCAPEIRMAHGVALGTGLVLAALAARRPQTSSTADLPLPSALTRAAH